MPNRPLQPVLALLLLAMMPPVCAALPDYAVSLIDPSVRVLHGQAADLVLRVDFDDGFTTDGIIFQVPEAPAGAASFAPLPMIREGGLLLRIDTDDISPGIYIWHVEATADGSASKSVPFTLEVTATGELEFYTFDSSLNKITLTSLALTAQGVTNIYVAGRDISGYQLASSVPITLSSPDPGTLAVYPHPDGYYRLHAIDNGSMLLTATTPDGYSASLPVSISIPAEPWITDINVSPVTVSNEGDEMVVFTAGATGAITSVAYDGLTLVEDTSYWYNDGRSYIGTGYVAEGLEPGTYLFSAGVTSAAVRLVPLVVVNDPARGEIRGSVYPLVPNGSATGRLDLYDAGGVPVRQADPGPDPGGGEFSLSYLEPGTYKLRFEPTDQQSLDPQWWPNADSFDSAAGIVVSAGDSVEGIYFFPTPPEQPHPPCIISTAPADAEVGVASTASVTAVFSKPMDGSTLGGAFRVTGGNGEPIPGMVTCDGATAVFSPSMPFADGATCNCVVTTAATDTDGLSVEEDYTWSFLTAADALSVSETRSLADGISVSLAGKTVYMHRGSYAYAEERDRSSGIRLQGAIWGLVDGSVASLRGVMATAPGGERYIDVRDSATMGSDSIKPVGATVRTLESRMMDGLSVTTWGRVSDLPTLDSFLLSDGSEGGVIVYTPYPLMLAGGSLASVTGAAGWTGGRVIYAVTVTPQE